MLLLLLLLGVTLIPLVRPGKPAPPRIGLIKIRLFGPRGSRTIVPVSVESSSSGAFVIWEPCRVERKETGGIVVGGNRVRVFCLVGTNSITGPRVQFVTLELTGTNHGPWRLLLPAARYEFFARLETLLRKPVGTLVTRSRVLESLLRHSRIWVASDWFDEPSPPGFAGFPDPFMSPPGFTNFPSPFTRPGSYGALVITNDPARSGMSWSASGFPPSPRLPPSGMPPAPEAPRPWVHPLPDLRTPHENSQTFFFIVRNFGARYHRWPTNFAEVKSFAAAKENLQPEIPSFYNTAEFANAVFATDATGTLTISYHIGSASETLSLGGPPSR